MVMSVRGLAGVAVILGTLRTACGQVNTIDFDHVHETTYDAIVVGAGTSGCILAQTLAESDLHVLLIERGYNLLSLPPAVRLGTSMVAAPTAMIDETLSEITFTKKGVPYISGRTMGGMSAINLGGYSEENSDYFQMIQEDYAVEFDEVEWQRATEYIRNSGLLTPAPTVRKQWFNDWVITENKRATGTEAATDGRAPLSYVLRPEQMTRTFSLLNPVTNERMTSCSLLKSSNVDLVERSTVQSVVFEELGPAHNVKATCVTLIHNGEKETDSEARACIRTGGRIVIAAGVVNTPAILMRSGIGDSQQLAELGIKSVVHNPDVGTGFTDRAVSASNMWPTDEKELENDPDAPAGFRTDKSFNSHVTMRKLKCDAAHTLCPTILMGELTGGTTFAVFAGLLAEKRSKDVTTSSLFKSILRSQAVQLFQRVRARLAKDLIAFLDFLTFAPMDHKDDDVPSNSLDKFTNLVSCSRDSAATTIALADPKSRGTVTLNSHLDPELDGIYFSDPLDMEEMVEAVIRMAEYASTPPIVDLIQDRGKSCLRLIEPVMLKAMLSSYQRTDLYSNPNATHPLVTKDVFPPMLHNASRENIKTLINVFYLPGWHGTSTAAMGKVINNDFAVKGVDQLSVVDASALPHITRADPLATVLALGRYGGKKILEEIDRSEKREFE